MRHEFIDRDGMRTMIGWMFDVPENSVQLDEFEEFRCLINDGGKDNE